MRERFWSWAPGARRVSWGTPENNLKEVTVEFLGDGTVWLAIVETPVSASKRTRKFSARISGAAWRYLAEVSPSDCRNPAQDTAGQQQEK